jgi:hypothetical protein
LIWDVLRSTGSSLDMGEQLKKNDKMIKDIRYFIITDISHLMGVSYPTILLE